MMQALTREDVVTFTRGRLREGFENLPIELVGLTQSEVEKLRKPTENDYFLRQNLWNAVRNAQKLGKTEIFYPEIYGGICTEHAFQIAMATPLRLAYYLTPPTEDKSRMAAGLSIGISNLIDFVSKPVDPDTAGAFLKAIEILLNRVHGPVIQRVDARHAHVNLNKPVHSTLPPDDQQKRLGELKEKLLQAKDVTPATPNAE